MPIGKDSITKRVAKIEEPITEVKEEAASPAKKPAAKKTTSTTAKKPAAKKSPVVAASVGGNVSPETVEKVVGHKESAATLICAVGDDLPDYLL